MSSNSKSTIISLAAVVLAVVAISLSFCRGHNDTDSFDHEMVVDMQKLFRISSDKVEKYDGPDGTGELNSRDMFSLLLDYAAM